MAASDAVTAVEHLPSASARRPRGDAGGQAYRIRSGARSPPTAQWSDHSWAALCWDAREAAGARTPGPCSRAPACRSRPGRWRATPTRPGRRRPAFLADGADGVVIKAQVLVGGRGKAGGVKLARTADEAADVATAILGMDIKGITVRRVLVAPAADIVRELYLAAVLDRTVAARPADGLGRGRRRHRGARRERPRRHHDDRTPTRTSGSRTISARRMAFALGLGDHLKEAVAICEGLYRVLHRQRRRPRRGQPARDRPGAGRPDGPVERLALLDAKITIDDSALGRHPDLEAMRDLDEEDPVDVEARAAGLSFIRLDGDIGCMVNGAGLAMTTMDLVKRAGGRARELPRHRRRRPSREGRRGDAAHPRRPLGARRSS